MAETFHGAVLQKWDHFLVASYEYVTRTVALGGAQYHLPPLDLQLEPGILKSSSIADELIILLSNKFSFQKYPYKIKTVIKALGKQGSNIDSELILVRNEVIVRNLLQHNHGNIRQSDLDSAGVRCFKSKDHAGTVELGVNSRVRRTI